MCAIHMMSLYINMKILYSIYTHLQEYIRILRRTNGDRTGSCLNWCVCVYVVDYYIKACYSNVCILNMMG